MYCHLNFFFVTFFIMFTLLHENNKIKGKNSMLCIFIDTNNFIPLKNQFVEPLYNSYHQQIVLCCVPLKLKLKAIHDTLT